MKKTLLFAMAAVLAAACNVAELEEKRFSVNPPVFTASFENEGTRVYVDDSLHTHWTADDSISIFVSTYNEQYKFNGKTGDDNGTFSPVGESFATGNDIPTNYAVYPYNSGTSITTSGTITLNLPSTQYYAADSYGIGANTMVAVTESSSDKFLRFQNLCGFLVIKFYGEGTVKSIMLKGNNGEKLAGIATVSPAHGQAPEIVVSEDGAESITVDCGKGVALGQTSDTATQFWFAVPPVTFSKGFTITVTDIEGGTMEKSVTSSKSIRRNVKNSMAVVETQFKKKYVPEYVDLGLTVRWATCNLGATSPEESVAYYSWGDVVGQTWDGTNWPCSKFIAPEYELDGNGNLKPECDAAHVNYGGSWRMPTKTEYEELINKCTSTWTNDYNGTGVAGRIFTGKRKGYTDRSIFMPAVGYGYNSVSGAHMSNYGSIGSYWSSSYYNANWAWSLYNSKSTSLLQYCDDYHHNAMPIRPVNDEHVPVTSISLPGTCSLIIDSSKDLIATYQPEDASYYELIWSSSDESVATVSDDGLVTAVGVGTCTISASVADSDVKDESIITVKYLEPEYVDLGLSVKWANCNLGATSPDGFGRYYAWGDVIGQIWKNSKWSGVGFYTYPEYELDHSGNLKPEYDAAHVNLGDNWRMPTKAECQELIDNCTTTWASNYNGTGVSGRIFTSKKEGYTDSFIFMPAAERGYDNRRSPSNGQPFGYFWTNTFSNGNYALCFEIWEGSSIDIEDKYRRYGLSLRPVYGENIPLTSISLSETNVSLDLYSSKQLAVSKQPENASYFEINWSSSDKSIATVSADGLVTAVGVGTCIVTATSVSNSNIKADCIVNVYPGYVDLGLSVKWATCNVGGKTPYENGDYYLWEKACYESVESNFGWGSGWRMPTKAECQELMDNCTCSQLAETNYNGGGVRVTSKVNGNSIVIDASGWYYPGSSGVDHAYWEGYFWTSERFDKDSAYCLETTCWGGAGGYIRTLDVDYSLPVRLVIQ